jgi:PAS domain S-box-containing protein
MDTVAEGAVFVDSEGLITHVNRQTEEMFGFERTELINKPIEALVPERFRPGHVGLRNRYMQDPQPVPLGIGRELVGRRRDGTEFPMELSLSAIESDGGLAVLALVTDISERRKLEIERSRLSETVEDIARFVEAEQQMPQVGWDVEAPPMADAPEESPSDQGTSRGA